MKKGLFVGLMLLYVCSLWGIDHKGITIAGLSADRFTLLEKGAPTAILLDENENVGVQIAARNLQQDFARVSGKEAELKYVPGAKRMIVAGMLQSRYIQQLVKGGKLDAT